MLSERLDRCRPCNYGWFWLLITCGYVVLLATAILWTMPAHGHDTWINQERRLNAQGEWCCNENDCHPIPAHQIITSPQGYTYNSPRGPRFVPHAKAQPSSDNQYWECRRPAVTTDDVRCFFFPPGGV